MKKIEEHIEEQSQSYVQKPFKQALQMGPAWIFKILERATEEYLKERKTEDRKLLQEVEKMRASQREYFKNRSEQNLQTAKAWERHVDKKLKELDDADQLALF